MWIRAENPRNLEMKPNVDEALGRWRFKGIEKLMLVVHVKVGTSYSVAGLPTEFDS